MKNSKPLPGADMNTDHNYLVVIVNLYQKQWYRKAIPKQIDLSKLREREYNVQYNIQREYNNRVGNRTLILDNNVDIEASWKIQEILCE